MTKQPVEIIPNQHVSFSISLYELRIMAIHLLRFTGGYLVPRWKKQLHSGDTFTFKLKEDRTIAFHVVNREVEAEFV